MAARSIADGLGERGDEPFGLAPERGAILASHIALLCLGKSDFEVISAFRGQSSSTTPLGCVTSPEATLRQRRDEHVEICRGLVDQASEDFLRRVGALITALAKGFIPLAYDLLRCLSQQGLLGGDAPPRQEAKRRRLRTVMQELT